MTGLVKPSWPQLDFWSTTRLGASTRCIADVEVYVGLAAKQHDSARER